MTRETAKDHSAGNEAFHAWSPGLTSTIPENLLPQVTLYRPEVSKIDFWQARELSQFLGLPATEVIEFTTERLLIHELLIRVTVDLNIPDGRNYEDLGNTLRSMVRTIIGKYVRPDLETFEDLHRKFLEKASELIDRELAPLYTAPEVPTPSGKPRTLLNRLFGAKQPAPQAAKPSELDLIDRWNNRCAQTKDIVDRACFSALSRVVGKIVGSRGRLVGDRQLVRDLIARTVCNETAGVIFEDAVDDCIQRAAMAEGYHFLPVQADPVIMNVKGASASGKSTIRWEQRALAEKIGIPWTDFAIVSPDYWRKFLLNYESLGEDSKYGAMLTGQELAIVDKKLDQYLETTAQANTTPHLLIDRFRFDTFNPRNVGTDEATTRFGEMVYMFFMVTAPENTVERAWVRGLDTGRYKAVDDLLFHNVEAYGGMPDLFMTCARTGGKILHYEFLDNNVPKGEHPRTIAFGWNGHLTVLDVGLLLEVDRYRNINLKARRPEDLYGEDNGRSHLTGTFLKRCISSLRTVTFADYRSGRIFGKAEDGTWTWRDETYLDTESSLTVTAKELEIIGWFDAPTVASNWTTQVDVEFEKHHTLGTWGPDI